jgi:twitching motility protein PilT
MDINELLTIAVERGASDLHLKVGNFPMLRIVGALQPATPDRRLDNESMLAIAAKVLPAPYRDRFQLEHEIDLAYSVPGLGRFRCNAFHQRGTIGMVFRVIPVQVQSRQSLMLPTVIKRIATEERGLVLVTGTTGCGKSTTLAAMLDEINDTRTCHVMTVEDPIEYLHRDKKSIFCQREIGVDTNSFSQALRSSLRQDPDVILVGEMRDFETIETALHAAETGHLVLSTLHTLDATETISRIVSVFPPHQQKQIRLQLSSVLKAIVSQRLLPRADGVGRVPAVEVMVNTPFIKGCITEPEKTNLIHGAIAQGTSQYGMQTFDQSIFVLYERGLITKEVALRWASSPDDFKLKMQGIASTTEPAIEDMARNGMRATDRPSLKPTVARHQITRFTQ